MEMSLTEQVFTKLEWRRITLQKSKPSEKFGFTVAGGEQDGVELYVIAVKKMSIAENAGLMEGDKITVVAGADAMGISRTDFVHRVQESGMKVTLLVERKTTTSRKVKGVVRSANFNTGATEKESIAGKFIENNSEPVHEDGSDDGVKRFESPNNGCKEMKPRQHDREAACSSTFLDELPAPNWPMISSTDYSESNNNPPSCSNKEKSFTEQEGPPTTSAIKQPRGAEIADSIETEKTKYHPGQQKIKNNRRRARTPTTRGLVERVFNRRLSVLE